MRGVVCLICGLLAGPALAETITLERLDLPWELDTWNKAPGRAEPAGEGLSVGIDWPAGAEFRFFSVRPRQSRGAIPFRLREVVLAVEVTAPLDRTLEIHFVDADGKDQKTWLADIRQAGARELRGAIPGDWRQPLRFASLTWHNYGRDDAGGTSAVVFGELVGVIDETAPLAPDPAPTFQVWPDDPYGLADDAGTLRLRRWLEPWPGDAATYTAEYALAGADGTTIASGPLAGDTDLALPRCATYTVTVRLSAPGREPIERRIGAARLPRAVEHPDPATSSIGVNTHHNAPWALFGRLGVHWARDYSWGWLGRGENGPIGNGLDYRGVQRQAVEAGVIVLPICMSSFRNAAGTAFDEPEAIRAGFERLARALPEVPYWEIDNEFDYALPGRRFDQANYRRAVEAAAAGLQQSRAPAKLVLNGTAGILHDDSVALLESCPDSFAVVNSHYYTGTAPPEPATADANVGGDGRRETLTFADQLLRLSRVSHAAGKEHWLTEVGWDASGGPSVGETLQAVYLPRVYLLSRLAGCDKVFWYFDRDTEGTGIFSSCGLRRLDGSLRPCAVALAALSQQTSAGRLLGRLDLGDDDIWAVALANPGGDVTVAVWSVFDEHPLPAALRVAAAVDLFGNPAQPAAITPEIQYLTLPALPAGWAEQAACAWLSPTVLTVRPGTATPVEATAAGATLRWEGLPDGLSPSAFEPAGDIVRGDLRAAPTLAMGRHAARVVAAGDGWSKSFPVTILVEPTIQVTAPPYRPGQAEIAEIRSPLTGAAEVGLAGGQVIPPRFELRPGEPRRLGFAADDAARGLLALTVRVGDLTQSVPLRPLELSLPKVAPITADGDLREWPAGTAWPEGLLVVSRRDARPELRLAWSDAGWCVAARLPARRMPSGKLDWFWDYSSLELFVADGAVTQVVLMPEQIDGAWRLAVARWDRQAGRAERLEAPAALRVDADGATIEALLPGGLLPAPRAGARLRLGVALRAVGCDATIDAAWPRQKNDGLLSGGLGWVTLTP